MAPMPGQPPSSSIGPLLRLAFYGLAISLALVHVFITFRGLNSAEGMEQAQVAREMARGHFFQTKVIRPYAWARLLEAGKDPLPAAMPDITQPPLQPLIWAPIFKLLHRHQIYAPGKTSAIYLLDRAIACIGVTGFLLTLLWTHGVARRLFDETVAGVTALALVLCEPLWELSVSGSPVALLLPLFALAFRLYVSAVQDEDGGSARLLALGGVCALMVLTQWMAVWLVLGLVLAVALGLPGRRWQAGLVALLPAVALALWGAWTMQRCGDPLGGAKTLFQAHLLGGDVQSLQRQFSVAMPPVAFDDLLRKLGLNLKEQFGTLYAHLGYVLPALFFLAALLHRFRRPETHAVRLGLGLVFFCTLIGMGLLGLPDGADDDAALYPVLVPAMTAFGAAMMALLWARLQPAGGQLWSARGYAVIAVAVSALPMLVQMPTHLKMGLTMAGRFFPHWPPYVPERVAVVRKLLEPGEVVFADAPWFVAWYADTPAVWLPNKRSDFTLIQAKLETREAKAAGVVVTPVSARVNYLGDAFNGSYREWPDLIFRGPMIAFDKEFLPRPDFPYNIAIPLLAVPVGEKESLSLLMTFYTDKVRTPKD